jgi:hypothetical protein
MPFARFGAWSQNWARQPQPCGPSLLSSPTSCFNGAQPSRSIHEGCGGENGLHEDRSAAEQSVEADEVRAWLEWSAALAA